MMFTPRSVNQVIHECEGIIFYTLRIKLIKFSKRTSMYSFQNLNYFSKNVSIFPKVVSISAKCGSTFPKQSYND